MQSTTSQYYHQTFDVSGSRAAFSLTFQSNFQPDQQYYLTAVDGVIESIIQPNNMPSSSMEVFVFCGLESGPEPEPKPE